MSQWAWHSVSEHEEEEHELEGIAGNEMEAGETQRDGEVVGGGEKVQERRLTPSIPG